VSRLYYKSGDSFTGVFGAEDLRLKEKIECESSISLIEYCI